MYVIIYKNQEQAVLFSQSSLCGSAGLVCEHGDQYSAYTQCSDLDTRYWKFWWPSGVVPCSVFSLETDYKVGHTFSKIPWTEELFAALSCDLKFNILTII